MTKERCPIWAILAIGLVYAALWASTKAAQMLMEEL